MSGFKTPYRFDKTDKSGGLLTYVKNEIPSKILTNFLFDSNFQIIPIELNFRKCKWILFSIYRPPNQDLHVFINTLSEALLYYSTIYKNFLIMGDFNCTADSSIMKGFLENFDLSSILNKPTCFKSQEGTCIDLILTNKRSNFMHTDAIETGISDHHLLIHTMLRTKFSKNLPKKISYRCYRQFSETDFLTELSVNLGNVSTSEYVEFEKVFVSILDKHAPLKTKFLRANNSPHVTKTLRKAIMVRSKLKRRANISKSPEDRRRYCQQRNLVVKLNRQAKESYFKNAEAVNGKNFWKVCKPFFSDKSPVENNGIRLLEESILVEDESAIAFIFNQYFNTITDNLEIPSVPKSPSDQKDPLLNTLESLASHPSIVHIKSKSNSEGPKFHFSEFEPEEVKKVILGLKESKKVSGSLPVRILKLSVDLYVDKLTDCFNKALNSSSFPDELKLADIVPIHKKGSKFDKSNYRPVSLLPALSKVFERLIAKQINSFMEPLLSPKLCGFRKKYGTQHALLNLLRNWQNSLSNSSKVGALLMDLSKAFDCLPHDLLIAKLEAYGFGLKSLRFIFSYLNHRKHRVKIGSFFSLWLEILAGVPQGSVLGPILFNIFINDIFDIVSYSTICNFADDNTLSAYGRTIEDVIRKLNGDIVNVVSWFRQNAMVVNPDKFQLILPKYSAVGEIFVTVGSTKIYNIDTVKLLGILLDSKLSFRPHVSNICKKVSQKTRALARIRSCLSQSQANILFNSYIISHFNYCSLVWMFCDKTSHNLLLTTYRRALSVRYNDFSLKDCNFLERLNLDSLHQRNLRYLVTEIYKWQHQIGPTFVWSNLNAKPNPYNLRRGINIAIPRAKNNIGLNSHDVRASQAWNHLSVRIKNASSLNSFIKHIQNIKIYCGCTLCSCF